MYYFESSHYYKINKQTTTICCVYIVICKIFLQYAFKYWRRVGLGSSTLNQNIRIATQIIVLNMINVRLYICLKQTLETVCRFFLLFTIQDVECLYMG